jgi:hypothetical protein
MDFPRRRAAIAGTSWISRLVGFLGILLILQIIVQEVITLRSHPRLSALIVATASGHYSMAAPSVDLGWYPPNATVINNLTNVLDVTGVYGFIYNNSYPTNMPYGTYNWCNMPHVRKEEYTKPSDGYKLKYVELVSFTDWIVIPYTELISHRFTGIISVPSMPRTHFLSNHTAGIVTMKAFSFTGSLSQAVSQHIHTGMAIFHRPILSNLLGLLVAVNSLRLQLKVLTTPGNTATTYTRYTTTYYNFCRMIFQELCHSA